MMPMMSVSKIIRYSNRILSISSIPKRGKEVINRGRTAQWIAQARDAVTPSRSQLKRRFMSAKIILAAIKLQLSCNLYVNLIKAWRGGFTFARQNPEE